MLATVWNVRVQIGLLAVGHMARVFGENVARVIFLRLFLGDESGPTEFQGISALLSLTLITTLLAVPYLLYLGWHRTLRSELVLAGLMSAGGFSLSWIMDGRFVWGLGVIAVMSAVHFVARSLWISDLARGAGIGLPRLRAGFTIMTVIATVAGLTAGFDLTASPALDSAAWAVLIALSASWMCMLALTFFPTVPPERFEPSLPLGQARFDAIWPVVRRREAWLALGGLIALCWVGLMLMLLNGTGVPPGERPAPWPTVGWIALGASLTMLQPKSYRNPVWAFLGWLGLGVFGLNAVLGGGWNCPAVWASVGALMPTSVTAFQAAIPRRHQLAGFSLLVGVVALSLLLMSWGVQSRGWTGTEHRAELGTSVVVIALFGAVGFGCWHFRAILESIAEVVLWIPHRIRVTGSGASQIPRHGPALVVSNHAAYLDPLWLAKHIDRPTTPMMTSLFYDLWFIRPLMRLIGVIRVPDGGMRREAPELDEAIAALDRGECVVIFPEAYLRRKEDQPLRRFGQGVWRILKAKPDTPVFVCWIEGSWGSFCSYQGGPPMTGKRLDFWRRIDIAYAPGEVLSPELLESHMKTRHYLMDRCLEARTLLALPRLQGPGPIEEAEGK